MSDIAPSFLERHEFLIRRLHSLTGLIPVGAFVCVHLVVNASVLNSPETFQNNVYAIHALDRLLPAVEWAFIFLPILFHAIFGFMIIGGGLPNQNAYPYDANWRYTLQRFTGVVAFLFIVWHVFHMHGWFHGEGWLSMVEAAGGHQFRPYNASSTASAALSGWFVAMLYAIGVLACVYHLANGIWTMGITWGVWTTPQSQAIALKVCAAFGLALSVVGLSSISGLRNVDIPAAKSAEDQMYEFRVEGGLLRENEHKRSHAEEPGATTATHEAPATDGA